MIKSMMDGASLVVAAGAIVDKLPAIAALASIIWFCIRIWESKTVGGWVGRDKPSQVVERRSSAPHIEDDN